MAQTVATGKDLDKRAEVLNTRDDAFVNLADFDGSGEFLDFVQPGRMLF